MPKDTQTENNSSTILEERFAALPVALQRAIEDADISKHMRALAEKHKLHLDQWVLLENEILLVLLGIAEPEEMTSNIARELSIDKKLAQTIVNDIVDEVFEPIREQMQRELTQSGRDAHAEHEEAAAVEQTTTEQKQRPTDSLAYRSGESSLERRDVQDDPYRESIE